MCNHQMASLICLQILKPLTLLHGFLCKTCLSPFPGNPVDGLASFRRKSHNSANLTWPTQDVKKLPEKPERLFLESYSSEMLTCQKGEALVMNLQLQDLNSYDVTISKQLGILLKRPLGTQGVQPPCHISFLSEESNKVGFFFDSCNDLFAISLLDFRSDLFR